MRYSARYVEVDRDYERAKRATMPTQQTFKLKLT
jgi:hypothetical protein